MSTFCARAAHLTMNPSMFEFFNGIKSIRDSNDCIPSWLKITTITMTSNFNKSIDLQAVKNYFEKNESIRIRPLKSKFTFTYHRSDTEFFNQVSIYCDDYRSRKSVKLFPNGAIHVSGCSDIFDCERVLKQINCVVGHITKKKCNAHEYSVHMINSNFSLNCFVNLRNIFEIFSNAGHDATFNPDRYSAVKIKISNGDKKVAVVSIFSSGKSIITGAKNLVDVVSAYDTIVREIFNNKSAIVVSQLAENDRDVFDTWRGFKIEQWLGNYNSS